MTKTKFLKIGITSRITENTTYIEKRDAVSHDWPKFLEKIHAFPIIIPNSISKPKEFFDKMDLDGFVLTGGDNIGDNIKRDKIEKSIIEYGIKNKLPIFGVCRGMQVINYYFGGNTEESSNNKHVKNDHLVEIQKNNFSKINSNDSFKVNSYHHNIIKEKFLGKNLVSFALTKNDRTVEGFFHKNLSIMGVMWHPERQQKPFDKSLFDKFFNH